MCEIRAVKVGVNPEILENREGRNFQTITVMNILSIHFWNGYESENPLLKSNFTENFDFLTKLQKNHFFGQNNSWAC